MKLRIKGNTIRFRLTQSEAAQLGGGGSVEETTDFGGGQVLLYRLTSDKSNAVLQAELKGSVITILIPAAIARGWSCSDAVGVYEQCGPLSVSIEKDFRCLGRPEDQQEPGAYAHPAENCK